MVCAGLHASVGNAMLLVVSAYMLQIVLYGAYKRPREVTWWLVLGLVALVLGFLITGYRLTWDQRTFWALKVEVNITQSMPVLGDAMARMLLGGAEIGQATLTRLHALHVFVLPLAFVAVLVFKHYLVRLHGRAPAPRRRVHRRSRRGPGRWCATWHSPFSFSERRRRTW
ncbi:MAG: cytochrome b N-terminal domain-containing protein [Polyangiales bacterium]